MPLHCYLLKQQKTFPSFYGVSYITKKHEGKFARKRNCRGNSSLGWLSPQLFTISPKPKISPLLLENIAMKTNKSFTDRSSKKIVLCLRYHDVKRTRWCCISIGYRSTAFSLRFPKRMFSNGFSLNQVFYEKSDEGTFAYCNVSQMNSRDS